MGDERVVVGAIDDPETAVQVARRLRDAGREVVYVGGHQTPEQLVRAAVAEDAMTLVVDGDGPSIELVRASCVEQGATDVAVTPVDEVAGGLRSR